MKAEIGKILKKVSEKNIDWKDAFQDVKKLYQGKMAEELHVEKRALSDKRLILRFSYDEPYLKDHTVLGEQVLLGVTHLSLAAETARKNNLGKKLSNIRSLLFIKPIILYDGEQVEIYTDIEEKNNRLFFKSKFKKLSGNEYDDTASGEYVFDNLEKVDPIDISTILKRYDTYYTAEDIYDGKTPRPIVHGESLRTVRKVFVRGKEALGELSLTNEDLSGGKGFSVPPALLDGAIVSGLSGLLEEYSESIKDPFIPFMIKNCFFYHELPKTCYSYSHVVKINPEIVEMDISICDQDGFVLMLLKGVTCKRIREKDAFRFKTEIPGNTEKQSILAIKENYEAKKKTKQGGLKKEIEDYIFNKLSNVLGQSRTSINNKTNFMELGIDSNLLLKMAGELEEEIGIELYPTVFFEYLNVDELSKYLSEEYKREFARYFGLKISESVRDTEKNTTIKSLDEKVYQYVEKDSLTEKIEIKLSENHHTPDIKTSTKNATYANDDIAIIGMTGIFSKSPDLSSFWKHLKNKTDLIQEIPLDHFDYRPWFNPEPQTPDKMYCKWGSFIDDVDKFDAGFFNISPREAEWMDPQLRLLLQSIYATSEDAGYINQLRGTNTGVYIGVCFHDYADQIVEANLPIDPYSGTGNAQTVIANRVSFLFDLNGPSIAIDTACSSSLYAVHAACCGLKKRECDLAFVGGVNLLLSSRHYRYFSSIGALSPTGRCRTFDIDADGYVPGECIASILLKPYRQAKRDNDQIYAIIKGSAALHGGYTPSLTAPSVAGEENVILKAWQDAGIHPETLSYIEAHGTGTKLGDPIEISSLKKAFQKFTNKQNFCAIGSAKSNIGHTEGAAGIAGILKVILQMKNRQIPALQKIKALNPYIKLDESALYINRDIEEWKSPKGVPRRAGISSFGFSGAYAHIVIEEHIDKSQKRTSDEIGNNIATIIVLSAKNEDRLKAQSRRLLRMIQDNNLSENNLMDAAYTLQVGREHMEERLALIVRSFKELEKKLKVFIEGHNGIEDLYRGQVKRNKGTLDVFEADEDLRGNIENWIQKKEYEKLAGLWVKGLIFDWNQLYIDCRPRRISLPTYPFAKESYWITNSNSQSMIIGSASNTAALHPLLHQNTSNLTEQRYSSTFKGNEFFLKDHVVKGKRVLPAVAYLEMAREAVFRATGGENNKNIGMRFKNVVWARPIAVSGRPTMIQIGLFPEDDGQIAYEVYSEREASDVRTSEKSLIYSQGIVEIEGVTEVEPLDLDELKAQCRQGRLSARQCYDVFESVGIVYGPGHRGLAKVYLGDNQVLARLALPSCVIDSQDQFIMHPSMMDAALQGAIGLMNGTQFPKPALPFALQEMDIIDKCDTSMWALIRYSKGSKPQDKIQKLDIDVCDDTGKISVRLRGFSSRVLEGEVGTQNAAPKIGTMMLRPFLKEQPVAKTKKRAEYEQYVVMYCEADENKRKSIESINNGMRFLFLQTDQKEIDKRFEIFACQVFDEIQRIIKEKPKGNVLFQVIVPNQGKQQLFSGLSGLLKTAHLEYPKLICQLIEIDTEEEPEALIKKLQENSLCHEDYQIQYKNGKRMVTAWHEVEVLKDGIDIPYKDQGIYLITGGAGALGLIFAEEIARQVKKPKLILTGRTLLSDEKQKRLQAIATTGAGVEYKQVDMTKIEAVVGLVQETHEKFGKLNGIIHGAGVIRDNFIFNKSQIELRAVLAPKVTGLVNLDQASKDLNLDFFVLFSSAAGTMGNPGQADYAAANAFQDAFAKYRNSLVILRQRHGQTLSIDWPLWKEGGMRVYEETEKMMMRNMGIIPMDTQVGLRAFYHAINLKKQQIMVLQGDLKRLHTALLEQSSVTKAANVPSDFKEKKPVQVIAQDLLRQKAIHYFKKQLSSVIKLSVNQIEADAPLEQYGIDSVAVMELTNKLENMFGSLSKTLFFEYQNIGELTEYFIENYPDNLAKLIGVEKKTEIYKKSATMSEPAATGISVRNRARFASIDDRSRKNKEKGVLDIAIIGLSGRYPGARNIQEFWNNLRDGKDCITEIPKDRWDHSLYFDEDKNKPGKTYSKWGGFLEGVDKFDPLFFNITPREAEYMDPQERLFLQCVFETLEDAGYTRDALRMNQSADLKGSVGVYVGVMYEEYQLYGAQETILGKPIALSGSPSSIANRVSYFCNFNGPSMAVDTMCSSSLTTIHLACQSLRQGACALAIAGGVNVSIHPNKYLMLGQGRFVSSKGRCESFGLGGDGYVPGEGVGAILLKPLSLAIDDGDNIYGVIKATALNHGGKTNGYTVPNPNAQADVIGKAFKEAGINPRTISYIEAHGTGTFLGDPIEITGLTKTFRQYTNDKQFCSIGSAKSNIGHCESAAGISAVSKVLLQLKYRQLVPSLHSKTLNPNIDFSNTPFVVQQELSEWKQPEVEINGKIRKYPRIAGISSFGAGGSNAHVVIEEYIANEAAQSQITVRGRNPAIIVLSAKNKETLKKQAQRLLTMIKEAPLTDADLADMAYTLQVGREAMEERLAVIVESIKVLEEKLSEFMEGSESIEALFRGQVKTNKETLAVIDTDEEMQEAIGKWIDRKKYEKLIELWVKGLAFDWNRLYGAIKPRRISLPTYPFADERCWMPKNDTLSHSFTQTSAIEASLHPLLHQNTSDLSEQRFSSTFTGNEFFLKDHAVRGQRIIPAMTYLEMARAAVSHAISELNGNNHAMRIKNVIWGSTVSVNNQPAEIQIGLVAEDNRQISYEIYSKKEATGKPPEVFSTGSAELKTVSERESLDLAALQAKCSQSTLSAGQCYKAFQSMGITYGPGHQGLEQIYVGEDQVLAKLNLPSCISDTQDQFVLHPSLMDSALQGAIGLLKDADLPKPVFPRSLQYIDIFDKFEKSMWALIRYSNSSKPVDKVKNLDIDICNDTGRICAQIKGLSSRALEKEVGSADPAAGVGILVLRSILEEKSVSQAVSSIDYDQHLVMFCEPEADIRKFLESEKTGMHFVFLQSDQNRLDKRFEIYAGQAFDQIQRLIKEKPKGNVLVQIVVPNQGEQRLFSGLSGLLRTAHLENPKIIGQLIEIDSERDPQAVIKKIQDNSRCPDDYQIQYQNGKRRVAAWREVEAFKEEVGIPFKDKGTYLITGGAGGLGLIFAKEIARQVKDASLILTGRSALNDDKQARLKALMPQCAVIDYKQVDVTNKDAVDGLIQEIRGNFGVLDGIIHSAGVIHDNFIFKKTKEELHTVLSPKVTGLVNLDRASKDFSLDFFILFSSGAAAMGSPGQSDYAMANAFMDNYATYRNSLVNLRQRMGQTLSINWPLWKEGGMRVDKETEKMMRKNTGLIPMETSTGIHGYYIGVASRQDRVMVLEGDLSILREKIFKTGSKYQTQTKKRSTPQIDKELLFEKTLHQLKVLFGGVTKIGVSRIDSREPFENYGIDSIMITQLNQKITEIFGELSMTLFFEYQNLGALAGYFVTEYPQECMKLTGLLEKDNSSLEISSEKLEFERGVHEPTLLKSERGSRRRFLNMDTGNESKEPIAIIGISGRYPQAINLEAFWKNLESGKDCITEIPQDRWPLNGFFQPNPQEAVEEGKSYSKWGGFVEGVAEFDPLFFNISPRESISMDPQERLFIESCWEVFEDAGYTKNQLSSKYNRRIGVFAGITKTGYSLYGPDFWKQGEQLYPYTSFSSVANRISYLMDLQGPSMPIDTMCSSSLTAIHEACEHLHQGQCEMAVAGGVNLYLHPSNYIGLCALKMLSTDGQCKSFGKGGNGFVPGEGVGVVLLKRLSQAIEDQDHIYAVIRGSSINHGGKTNGYTVPSPTAQGELIREALEKAGVDARAVSYIEAHGTGTELGDPIEIAGLTHAFQKTTSDKAFCAIGSVKSNIGHLEAAAGIAGVTKILLQMKHKKIVASLHSEELNPNISFSNTPFVVQQKVSEWKQPEIEINGLKRQYPRIAGVSSFGAGGSNAHVVLEEYVAEAPVRSQIKVNSRNPAVIVLSAKNEERLKDQAHRLLTMIKNTKLTDADLVDMAYTLQVGREDMEERLAVIVESIEALEKKLTGFVKGENGIEALFRGQVKRNKETLAVFDADEDMAKMIDAWMAKGKYEKLLDLWVKGFFLDWNKLYGDIKPRRISLPTYPFARERYWIPKIDDGINVIEKEIHPDDRLHPLIDVNVSTVNNMAFIKRIKPDAHGLLNGLICQKKVIPDSVYLEMALAAGNLSQKGARVCKIKNVIWAKLNQVDDQPNEIEINLYPHNRMLEYEISALSKDTKHLVSAQGTMVCEDLTLKKVIPEYIDLNDIKKRCRSPKNNGPYKHLKHSVGLKNDDGFNTIKDVFITDNEALVLLELPQSVPKNDLHEYTLHPAFIEGAVQSAMMLSDHMDPEDDIRFIPFALKTAEIISALQKSCYAYITFSEKQIRSESEATVKFNMLFADRSGQVLVKIIDFSMIRVKASKSDKMATHLELMEMTYNRPAWKKSVSQPELYRSEGSSANHVLIFACHENKPEALITQLKDAGYQIDQIILVWPGKGYKEVANSVYEIDPENKLDYQKIANMIQQKDQKIDRIIHMWSFDGLGKEKRELDDCLSMGIFSVLYISQALMALRPEHKIQLLYVYHGNEDDVEPVHAALGGFCATIRQENANFFLKTVGIKSSAEMPNKLTKFQANLLLKEIHDSHIEVRYQGNERFVRILKGMTKENIYSDQTRLKENGVYIITGGAGGLGLIFAELISERIKARLVLTGRSDLSEDKITKIEKIKSLGSEVVYLKSDVSDPEDAKNLIKHTRSLYGTINGLIHCAGVIRDAYIMNKTRDEINSVIKPKVFGTINLDNAAKNELLDFFVMFSSAAAVLGNIGQCDYAFGNSFMDYFAVKREQKRKAKKRSGKTISINWPLWRKGGMHIDEQTENRMEKILGITPLGTENGIRAFEDILKSDQSQVMVLSGNRNKIDQLLKIERKEKDATKRRLIYRETRVKTSTIKDQEEGSSVKDSHKSAVKLQDIKKILRQILSNITGIAEYAIESDTEWEEMGIDSVLGMKLLQQIETKYGLQMYPNELIENNTISKLEVYLAQEVNLTALESDEKKKEEIPAGSVEMMLKERNIVQRNSEILNQPSKKPIPDLIHPPIIFLLSTPRAGSTLTRVMLMGNPKIFAPPELHLLPFVTLKQRSEILNNKNQKYLKEGLVEAIGALEGLSANLAIKKLKELEEKEISVKETYKMLQDLAGERYIVDKSPSYAMDPLILEEAERICRNPLYIHLVRHPLSVMESFVRNRFHKMLGVKDDPWAYVEQLWFNYNNNIKIFLSNIPQTRKIIIRYEDLVRTPEEIMNQICFHFSIPFDKSMLKPYQGNRMTTGLHENSMTIGDINFPKHNKIDPKLANLPMAHLNKLDCMGPQTICLAREMGYSILKMPGTSYIAENKTDGAEYKLDEMSKKPYALSPGEKSIITHLGPNQPVWNIVSHMLVKLNDKLDFERFKESFQKVAKKNPVLRRYFLMEGERIVKLEKENLEIPVSYHDMSALGKKAMDKRLSEIDQDLNNNINIHTPPLLGCAVADIGKSKYDVITSIHEIISDGATVMLFYKELMDFYMNGEISIFNEDRRYDEYVNNVNDYEKRMDTAAHHEFWLKHIGNKEMICPTDWKKGPENIESEMVYKRKNLYKELGIKNKAHKAKLFFYLSVGLYRFLSEWTSDDNPVIIHRLMRRSINSVGQYFDVMGRFVGNIPLRLTTLGENQVHSQINAFKKIYQEVPDGGISYELLCNRGLVPPCNRISPVLLNFQPEYETNLKGHVIEWHSQQYFPSTYDRIFPLEFIVRLKREHLLTNIRYSKNSYKLETIKNISEKWIQIIKSIIAKDK